MTILNVINKSFFGLPIGSKSNILYQLCNKYPLVRKVVDRFYPNITAMHETLEEKLGHDKLAVTTRVAQDTVQNYEVIVKHVLNFEEPVGLWGRITENIRLVPGLDSLKLRNINNPLKNQTDSWINIIELGEDLSSFKNLHQPDSPGHEIGSDIINCISNGDFLSLKEKKQFEKLLEELFNFYKNLKSSIDLPAEVKTELIQKIFVFHKASLREVCLKAEEFKLDPQFINSVPFINSSLKLIILKNYRSSVTAGLKAGFTYAAKTAVNAVPLNTVVDFANAVGSQLSTIALNNTASAVLLGATAIALDIPDNGDFGNPTPSPVPEDSPKGKENLPESYPNEVSPSKPNSPSQDNFVDSYNSETVEERNRRISNESLNDLNRRAVRDRERFLVTHPRDPMSVVEVQPADHLSNTTTSSSSRSQPNSTISSPVSSPPNSPTGLSTNPSFGNDQSGLNNQTEAAEQARIRNQAKDQDKPFGHPVRKKP